jgi:hypothetical protein
VYCSWSPPLCSGLRAILLAFLLQVLRDIGPTAFRTAYDEWKRCQADLRLYLGLINDLICPACSDGLGAVHIDANMKLFTWLRHREEWRTPHYTEFFRPDDEVKAFLKAVYELIGRQVCAQWLCCALYLLHRLPGTVISAVLQIVALQCAPVATVPRCSILV